MAGFKLWLMKTRTKIPNEYKCGHFQQHDNIPNYKWHILFFIIKHTPVSEATKIGYVGMNQVAICGLNGQAKVPG
jgi:hypothetical protein